MNANPTKPSLVRELRGSRLFLTSFMMVAMSASSQAQNFFNFVGDGADDVLATLELSTLPATSHTDVIGFSLTSAGNAVFGFGVGPFPIPFDGTNRKLSLEVNEVGELRDNTVEEMGVAPSLFATDPPVSGSVLAGAVNPVFRISFLYDRSQLGADDVFGLVATTSSNGRWLSVPEPGSGILCLAAILFGVGSRLR